MVDVAAATVSTVAGARSAIDVLDKAIDKVATERGGRGAVMNRLQYIIYNLRSTPTNQAA
jgi:flagellin